MGDEMFKSERNLFGRLQLAGEQVVSPRPREPHPYGSAMIEGVD
jgi:hypothetical protein